MRDLMSLHLREGSQVSEARRMALSFGRGLGFDEPLLGKVALVVTEMGTNLVKHASGGEVLLRSIQWEGANGMEILSLDKGPGMRNLN